MTSVGIEPTTSGLDLPLLCRLSYEVGQRKSGTIKVVNRGEEKVRAHVNVVLRSTMNICNMHVLVERIKLSPSYLIYCLTICTLSVIFSR